MSADIRVGYSGTRKGMTSLQVRGVYAYLRQLGRGYDRDPGAWFEGHHGDCTGGDHEFHTLITALGWRTVAHPPVNARFRAGCKADEIREPKDYLARDWDIAQETGELLAAPSSPVPVPGSGTWVTIGYAVQFHRPVRVWLPDGAQRPGYEFFGAPLPAIPVRKS